MRKSLNVDDTICGIAAANGSIGIIRVSGPDSFFYAGKIFTMGKSNKTVEFESHRVYYGHIVFGGEILDEVLIMAMKAPRSYTCEDVIEIHCHGGVLSLQRIMAALLSMGVRMAEQGEFTKRAFLNGRIDLSQAEAVLDIVTAKTDLSHRSALNQLGGNISQEIKEYRNIVLSLIANIEANIDYPENDIEELSAKKIREETQGLIEKVSQLIKTADTGKIIREGIQTVILGKPNVGKSSFLNMLLQEDRAIVTDIPGTTRDALQEYININGIPLKITDTAGIRETNDTIEKIGVERSKQYAESADLVLVVLDASEGLTPDDINIFEYVRDKKKIVLINKTDLENKLDYKDLTNLTDMENVIEISAAQNVGMDNFTAKLGELFFSGGISYSGSGAIVSNMRHKNALINALASLENVIETIDSGLTQDFISIDLTDAYSYLGEITGDSVDEDIIDKIFAEFCLGK